jgi:hypothetical protein
VIWLSVTTLCHFAPFLNLKHACSHYCQQRAITPDPVKNFQTSAPKCHYYLQRAVTANWMGSKGEETLREYKQPFIVDE